MRFLQQIRAEPHETQIGGIAAATGVVKILKNRFFNPSIVRDGEEGTVAPFFESPSL
jgi:hypothetical protein